jgi:phospholipid/cholesterol/gamma-HCH transport system substrate-binding protein
MKYGSEIKIGITGIVTVIVIIWGVNYLKGRNILKSNYLLTAHYSQVDGLEASASIMLNGFKIGSVDEVVFKSEAAIPFTVIMEIEKKYKIRKGSVADIYSSDLLGSKAIQIFSSESKEFLSPGDTIKGSNSDDMLTSMMNEIKPLTQNINEAVKTLDSVGRSINSLLNDPGINLIFHNLESVSGSLKAQLAHDGDLGQSMKNLKSISAALSSQNASIQNTIANLDSISSTLNDSNLDTLIINLSSVGANLSEITASINAGEGSLGKLFSEDSLYKQMSALIADLDSLVKDVNSNPKKYVQFSLIGK